MERSRDTGQSSKAERTHRGDDVIRRLAKSSRENDAELSDRPMKRPRLNETEAARAQAIEKGRAKMQKYQQEADCYKDKDRDTFNDFINKFVSGINSKEYVLNIKSVHASYGIYNNNIDVENRKILGMLNFPVPDSKEKFHLSEIVFNQLCLAMEHLDKKVSDFDLKCWYDNIVNNEETKKTAELFFPEEKGSDGKIKEGRKTLKAGEDGFIALAGTPTAQSKFYLLAQHPKAFPGKKVTSITVIRHSNGQIDIEYQFGSQLEQKEKASSKSQPCDLVNAQVTRLPETEQSELKFC
jgi:hypothetical protein